MEKPRYTEKQILCGIREWFHKLSGIKTPFDANTRIDHFLEADHHWTHKYFRRVEDEPIDFEAFFSALSYYFRFRSTSEEWAEYFHLDLADYEDEREEWERLVAPGFTFGALARFIAAHAPGISFAPVTVIDRECRPSGVFYGIQRVVKNIIEDAHWFPPPETSIGPSTNIRDVFRGDQFDSFWFQLRWMTERGIPELPQFWRKLEMTVLIPLICLLFVGCAVLASIKADVVYVLAAFCIPLLGLISAIIYKQITNPLPTGIETFGDLSALIANHDCDVLRKDL